MWVGVGRRHPGCPLGAPRFRADAGWGCGDGHEIITFPHLPLMKHILHAMQGPHRLSMGA
jgi:hypothetical protein